MDGPVLRHRPFVTFSHLGIRLRGFESDLSSDTMLHGSNHNEPFLSPFWISGRRQPLRGDLPVWPQLWDLTLPTSPPTSPLHTPVWRFPLILTTTQWGDFLLPAFHRARD